MPDIHDDVKKSFELTGLRREAMSILKPDAWQDYTKLRDRFDGLKRYEERHYRLEYNTRVETEKKRLIDKAGAKDRNFMPIWSRNDRFNPTTINKQAHRNVRYAHVQEMARLDQQETRAIESLMDRSVPERAARGQAKTDFARAVDRRDSEDRRENQNMRRRIRTRD